MIALHPYDDEAEVNKFQTERGVDFFLDEPDFSEVTDESRDALEAQRAYITKYLQMTEDAIFGDGFADEGDVPYSRYLDLDSAASYWWIQEFSSNVDAYRTSSTYLYKKREGKLYWGPVWDFDMAFDYDDEEDLSSLNTATPMPWIDHLRGHDPEFQQLLRERWDEFDRVLQDITCQGGVLDQYAAEIKASWESNYEHWSPLCPVYMPTYSESISSLRDGIEARRKAINASIDETLDDVFCTVTFMVGDDVVKAFEVKHGEALTEEDFPEDPHKDGYWFYQWESEDGTPIEPYMHISEDTIVRATLIPDEDVIRPEFIAFPLYEQWVDINDGTWSPDCAIRPYDVQDDRLIWTSSTSEVAEFGDDDCLNLNAVGTTTVTCTASNGVSSSLVLHVYDSNVTPAQNATALQLDAKSLTLRPGQYGQARVTIEPQPTTADLTYESSDENVAEVSGYGVVEGISAGTCTIVVRDSVSGLEATFQVTVIESSDDEPDGEDGQSSDEASREESKGGTDATPSTTLPQTDDDNAKPGRAAAACVAAGLLLTCWGVLKRSSLACH